MPTDARSPALATRRVRSCSCSRSSRRRASPTSHLIARRRWPRVAHARGRLCLSRPAAARSRRQPMRNGRPQHTSPACTSSAAGRIRPARECLVNGDALEPFTFARSARPFGPSARRAVMTHGRPRRERVRPGCPAGFRPDRRSPHFRDARRGRRNRPLRVVRRGSVVGGDDSFAQHAPEASSSRTSSLARPSPRPSRAPAPLRPAACA